MTYFYPRPPRGGRRQSSRTTAAMDTFLSTPSARRATRPLRLHPPHTHISIHALREEGDTRTRSSSWSITTFLSTPSARRATHFRLDAVQKLDISIHALREEGDLVELGLGCALLISIHALREEGDTRPGRWGSPRIYFYPRPPRGGRLQRPVPATWSFYFYPRPPRGGRLTMCGIR